MPRQPAVYIMTNHKNGTLYTGMTAWFPERIFAHVESRGSIFCKRYKLTQMVYYELHPTAPAAILREKQIKAGSRANKIKLIEANNPDWQDLYVNLNNA
jgi:putative endonuclease